MREVLDNHSADNSEFDEEGGLRIQGSMGYAEGYSLNAASEYANDLRLDYLQTVIALLSQKLSITDGRSVTSKGYFSYQKNSTLRTVTKAPMAHRQ